MDLGIEGLGDATKIGVGGSAVVYRSRQSRLDREVAVKVLNEGDEAFVRRFEREARTLGKLSQKPGIVTVHDSGVTGEGLPYLVLELCPSSLEDRLKADGPLDPWEACRILAQVSGAVAEAHQLGIVHRDLKPANILVSPEDEPLVTDFGLSTLDGVTVGHTSSIGFTPGYVAPETLQGQRAEEPADVYALGATLFHLVAGHPPFVDLDAGMNLLALANRVGSAPVPNLRPRGVPNEVCDVIETTMAKKPADRPTARSLEYRLSRLAADRGASTASPSGGTVLAPELKGQDDRADGFQGRTPGPSTGQRRPASGPPRQAAPAARRGGPPPPRGRPHPRGPRPAPAARRPGPIPPYAYPSAAHPIPRGGRYPPPTPVGPYRPVGFVAPPGPGGLADPVAGLPPAPRRRSGFTRFLFGFIRGFLSALIVFVVGVILFLLGLELTQGNTDFDSELAVLDQAGVLGLIGLILYVFGTPAAFVAGIFWFPWPKSD